MKWVLIILGAVVGLIAVVMVIGFSIPEEHTATRAAKYQRSAEEIWQTVMDFTTWPQWNTSFHAVEKLPNRNDREAWVAKGAQGDIPMEVTEIDTARKLVTRIIDDGLPFGGTWTYELAEEEGGTLLRITEDGFVRNPVFRFMARLIFGYHSTMEAFLVDLGRKFGEEVVVIE